MKITRKITTDVLVVGSGLSGIKASVELASSDNKVLIVTKTKLASGSSFYPLKASLGTQVTKDNADKETFLQDIDDLSRGMHRKDLAEVYVDEIPERVEEYKEMGVNAKLLEGERKACFAKHPRDIYLLSDWDQIRENVNELFRTNPNIHPMEKTVAVSLVIKEDRIVGAVLLDAENEFVLVECKAVILATGGFGSMYKHNLNPVDVDGSGHVLALEAGASLVNMEFIQFIPGITSPRYKTLFGEHTLNYCRDIVNYNGVSILDPYLPKELSKEECIEIRSSHGPFTHTLASKYFDIAMMKTIIKEKNEEGFKLSYDDSLYTNDEEFYTVYLDWLKEMNVHLIEDEIKIAPFAHASNGGVYIDTYGRTEVNGLYAIGELSSNIEGANRLGGNSTGACMVFGKRTAADCEQYIQSVNSYELSEADANSEIQKLLQFNQSSVSPDGSVDAANRIVGKIKEIMWYCGNVVRTEQQLDAALVEIKGFESILSIADLLKSKHSRKLAIKVRNFIILSQLLLHAMKDRRESRGAHYRDDYPTEDPNYNKRLFISQSNNQVIFAFKDQ